MASLLAVERFLPPYRYEQEVVTPLGARVARGGRGPARPRASSRSTPRPASRRAPASCRSRRSSSRGDFEAQNDRLRRDRACRGRRARAPGARAAAARALASVGLDRQRLLHRLHDPGRRRLRGGRAGHGPAAGAAADHRERLRGRRGRPGARRATTCSRIPTASRSCSRWSSRASPSSAGTAPPTNVVSTAIFGDGGAAVVLVGPEHPRAHGRALRPHRGRGERLLPGHDAPDGLPPAQPGPADHPRPRAGAVRAARGRPGRRRLPRRARPRRAKTSRAGSCTPADGASSR